ncbi:MAG: M50 family metallopeptidase [Myxococcales bacterium]|nr:M50 family metallopeptidase [Myxococcales bacterium]MCB9668060.1 M50 family metallopeptidase [Alphaproteobacteria bacterium]
MASETTKKIAGLVLIGLAAMAFWDHVLLWPFKVLVVLFHELGHALAALATGGSVVSIELSPDQGGLTKSVGGLRFFILSAGYLGSLAFGVLWLFLGRTARTARIGVRALAALLVVTTLIWVRPVASFGFLFTMLASLVAIAVVRLASPAVSQWILRALGVFSVLYALWDIRDDVLSRSIAGSDASQLADLTFIPAPAWGIFWLGLGAGVLYALRKWI